MIQDGSKKRKDFMDVELETMKVERDSNRSRLARYNFFMMIGYYALIAVEVVCIAFLMYYQASNPEHCFPTKSVIWGLFYYG